MVLDLLLVSGDPFLVVFVVGEIERQLVFSHWVGRVDASIFI